jgi:pyrroloquinoline-quinone synthase
MNAFFNEVIMQFNKIQFLETLDHQIDQRHLLKHPFYIAWSEGKLSKECLKEYALEYYHHVKAFPRYLSALHFHTDDDATRREILKNLIDEEAGTPNHPELWREFALALGASEDELEAHEANDEVFCLVNTFKKICAQGTVSEGLAALYAYESQVPAISLSKIDGLKQFYGFEDPADWKYFSVHAEADVEHAAVERKLLSDHIVSEQVLKVREETQKVLDALWNFLTGFCHRYQIAC